MAARRRRKKQQTPLWATLAVVIIMVIFTAIRGIDGYEEDSPAAGSVQTEETFTAAGSQEETGESRIDSADAGRLEVHYLDVGQGDCTLIRQGDHAMLIDGGNNSWGDDVTEYLNQQGITALEYVIGTHPDADHIGGLDYVVREFDCDTIIMPDYEKDTKTYTELIDEMDQKGIPITYPVVGAVYSLGTASFTIINPGRNFSNANDCSVAIRMQHGARSFLFAGDAEEDAEEEMLSEGVELQADVYKVAHHGSRTASTEEFMEAVKPTFAVISVGEGNSYGHPHAEVLNRLRSMGVRVFRTDEQGTVVAVSDGEEITFNMSPSESWQAGE